MSVSLASLAITAALAIQDPAVSVLAPIPPVTEAEFALGQADASTTIVVYTSFNCVACGAWHQQVLPELIEQYVSPGKVRIALRMLPVSPREVSNVAAAIAWCAAPEKEWNVAGSFFEGVDAMMEGAPIMDWYLAGIASSGKTVEEIQPCIEDAATLSAIREEAAGAKAAGVEVTPAFFVNGVQVLDGTLENLANAVTPANPR